MALEGTFKDFHVADIVQLIGLQRKTGTLTLEGEEDTLAIAFQDGAVTWAQSTRVPWEQRMLQVLEARGLVTAAQLQEALNAQKEGKQKQSVVLAEKGILQKKDWDAVLAREVEEAVFRPFRWSTGRYRFAPEGSVGVAEGKIGPLGAENVLMEGIRRVDEWPMILGKIPSRAMVLKVGSGVGNIYAKKVEPNEVKMLDLVDGKRTVQELVDASELGEFEAMRNLASLMTTGAVVSVGPVPTATVTSVEVPATRVAAALPLRAPTPYRAWVARLLWGMAGVWLLASAILFRMEPSGLWPLSRSRMASLDRVRSLRARADLAELTLDVEQYVVNMGEYPTSLEALGAYRRPVRDPWGHLYQIRRAGTGDGADTSFGTGGAKRVFSGGPDGRSDTPDDIAEGDR
jgi:hypothetical protein